MKCQSCRDEFEAEAMCIHFDDYRKHTFCIECCANFHEIQNGYVRKMLNGLSEDAWQN